MKFWIIHEDYYEDLKLYDPIENSDIVYVAKSEEEANNYIDNIYNKNLDIIKSDNKNSKIYRNTISDLITEKKRIKNNIISTIKYYSIACHKLYKDKESNEYMKLTSVNNYVYNIIEIEIKENNYNLKHEGE